MSQHDRWDRNSETHHTTQQELASVDGAPAPWPEGSRAGGGPAARWHSRMFASLALRDFRWLWLSSMAGFMAMQMQMVARGWLIYDLTASPIALALVMASMGLPMTLLSPIGGALTDRVSKRTLLGWSLVASIITTMVVAVLIHLEQIAFWHLLLSGFLNGMVGAFQMPGRFSFVPQVAGEERLVNAIALNTSSMNLTRILAPALAGGLIGFIGTAGVFDLIAVFYALAAVCVFMMHHRGEPLAAAKRGTLAADTRAGLVYVRRNTLVLTLLVVAFISLVFGMPYQMLMPAFTVDVLHLGSQGLGILMAIIGVGAVAGSLGVAAIGNSRHMGLILLGSAALWGGALAAFSQSGSMAAAVFPLLVAGMASAVFMSINMSMMQLHSAPEMRGRVMSIFMWTFGLMPLGLLPMSAVAAAVGTPTAFLGSGVLLVVATGVLFLLLPSLRRLSAAPAGGERLLASSESAGEAEASITKR